MPKLAPIALAAFAAVMLFAAAGAGAASAQQPIRIISDQTQNQFPRGVLFSVVFSAAADVKEVRLQYHLAPDGTGATAVASCTAAGTTTCTYALVSGNGISIIPGAEITYHWDIEDTAGDKLSTDDTLYIHQDTRFTFQTLQQDNIRLYYHAGGDVQARAVLGAVDDTIQKVSALERTQVTFPVKVFLYTTAEEMQPAIAPGQPGRGVQILGEVVYSDTAMVSSDVSTLDIVRHEVAHIVTGQATKGPFGIAPWLNEGISVYSQSRPLENHASALQSAISSDRVLSFKELNSSASGSVASTVGLYYGEAGSIVKFLVETYGADKFADLLKVFKDGSTPDKAFQTVYGFDQLGMENAWRASVGLPARSASASPTPQPTQEARAAITSAAKIPASSSSSGGGGTSAITIAIIVALAVLLLAVIAAAATVVRRRM
jgi:Peptidase MA superfamily